MFPCVSFLLFYLTAAKQELTPVSGEVTGCDLNSEEIKPGLSQSSDSSSKRNLTASNSQAAILSDKRAERVINFSEAGHFSFFLLSVGEL